MADIRDPDEVFDAVRPEAVFHLAAQADVRVSVERPDVDADVNVLGTVRILEAARRHGAKIVFASTGGAIYGECDGPAPERPSGARSRRTARRSSAARSTSRPGTASTARGHVSLRFGNVYGPRQEPHGEAGVVAIFMGLLRDGGTPKIYGDGSQTRDYVFVADVVRAMLAAFDHDGRRLQRRHRASRRRCSTSTPRSSARAASSASRRSRRRGSASCSAACSTSRSPRASSAGGPSTRSTTGSRRRGAGSAGVDRRGRESSSGRAARRADPRRASRGAPRRSSSARSRRSSSSR